MNTYRVSKNGSDADPGNSLHPFATIQKGLDTATEGGDIVEAEGGEYFERVQARYSGTDDNKITLKNYAGQPVSLNGSFLPAVSFNQAYGKGMLEGFNVHNFEVDGINAMNSPYAGVLFNNGCSKIDVLNLSAIHCAASAIWIGHSAEVLIRNILATDICRLGTQEGISIVSVDGFDVGYCTVSNIPKEYLYGKSLIRKAGVTAKVGSKNGSVHHCAVSAVESCVRIDGYGQLAENIDLYNNLLFNADYAGIALGGNPNSQGVLGSLRNINLYNNVFVGNAFFGVEFDSVFSSGEVIHMINNTLCRNGVCDFRIYAAGTKLTGLIVRNNILASDHGILNFVGYDASEHVFDHNVIPNDGIGQYDDSDPLMVDPENWDFRLQLGSPCIDAGSPSLLPITDFYDNLRTQADIGAIALESVPSDDNGDNGDDNGNGDDVPPVPNTVMNALQGLVMVGMLGAMSDI